MTEAYAFFGGHALLSCQVELSGRRGRGMLLLDMVRDDLEACLQAYQFAELLLRGLPAKAEKERQEALEAAQRLRDEVEPRYEAASSAEQRSEADLAGLKAARARLDAELLRYR